MRASYCGRFHSCFFMYKSREEYWKHRGRRGLVRKLCFLLKIPLSLYWSYRFFSVTEQWLCLIPAVFSKICGVLEMIISFVTLLINKNRSFCYKAKHTHTRNHIKKLEYLELAKSHFDETAPGGITSQWLSVRLCLVGPLMHYEIEKWMISIVRARRFIPYFAKSIESGAMERTIEGFLQGIVSNQCF